MLEAIEGLFLIVAAIAVGAFLFYKAKSTNHEWPKNPMVINLLILLMIGLGTYGIGLEINQLINAVS